MPALHDLFALAILGLAAARLWLRHEALRPLATPAVPDGRRADTVRFYPHATTRMALWLCAYLLVLTVLVFFLPRWLGQGSALIAADQPVAPLGGAVIPPWYFLPFYGIVQAVPDRIGAILLALGRIGGARSRAVARCRARHKAPRAAARRWSCCCWRCW